MLAWCFAYGCSCLEAKTAILFNPNETGLDGNNVSRLLRARVWAAQEVGGLDGSGKVVRVDEALIGRRK